MKKNYKIFETARFLIGRVDNIPRKSWLVFQPTLWRFLSKLTGDEKMIRQYFRGKRGIRIGGTLRWTFDSIVEESSIVDVNAVEMYLNEKNKVDYIGDAGNLNFAKDGEFDFICSAHLLEHMPNPIKVLKEWMRVIGPGGLILCGVPDKRFTFDHRRPRTTLKHLINDFEHQENGQSEHAIEFVLNWDADMDRFCSYQEFKRNLLENPLVYTHFHCWTRDDICQLFDYVGLDIAYSTLIGDTAYIIGRKGPIEREISV